MYDISLRIDFTIFKGISPIIRDQDRVSLGEINFQQAVPLLELQGRPSEVGHHGKRDIICQDPFSIVSRGH